MTAAPNRDSRGGNSLARHLCMGQQTCVYVLRSERHPRRFYTGLTSNLHARLAAHNRGESTHTATGRPGRIVASIEFADAARAKAFEEYLKTGSGRAFAARHFR